MSKYRMELTGVFGDPVDDNPTVIVEEAGYNALDLPYRYLTVKVLPKDLETAMKAVKAFHMKGINLTMPHKIKVLPFLDELSEAAGIIGAVNTVVNRDGRLFGENTDGKGFLRSLMEESGSPEGKTVCILGAGGAARAIAVECALAGAKKIYIINRTRERGEELAALLNEKTKTAAEYLPWNKKQAIPEDAQILIQGTGIGLLPHGDDRPDIDYDTVREGIIACDVVFNPPQTLFLKECKKYGAVTITGLGMLVNQAALNFTLWTGQEAPYDVMYEALLDEFQL